MESLIILVGEVHSPVTIYCGINNQPQGLTEWLPNGSVDKPLPEHKGVVNLGNQAGRRELNISKGDVIRCSNGVEIGAGARRGIPFYYLGYFLACISTPLLYYHDEVLLSPAMARLFLAPTQHRGLLTRQTCCSDEPGCCSRIIIYILFPEETLIIEPYGLNRVPQRQPRLPSFASQTVFW